MSKGFSKKASSGNNQVSEDKVEKPFVRDETGNKLFKEIQVKDITKYITDETVGCWDYDTPVYKVASSLETKYIRVVCNSDKTVTDDIKNVTTFKGRGKKVSESSWLGLLNVKREMEGKTLLTPEDFTVTELQKLKYTDEDKTMEQAKITIYKNIKKIKEQYGLKHLKLLIGSGDNFRNKLPTCRAYKGNRAETLRPLLLKKLRTWVEETLDVEVATARADGEHTEADDHAEYYGNKGYQHYRKEGWFSHVVLSADKDSYNSAKYLIDPSTHTGESNPLRGQFKFPQAMLIEATDRCAGNLELVAKANTSEVKGYGFKFLMYQASLGKDSADNYDALSHLDQGLTFGSLSAYKALQPCKTAKEALQASIDVFAELLPYGVQYTTHDGIVKDVDTLEYMNTYFLVAYMLRSAEDTMDFYKLCKAFKVDVSAITDNNSHTAPVKTYVGSESHVKTVEDLLEDIIKNDFKGLKAMKKADKAVVLDTIKDKLLSVNFDDHYEMQQTLKVGFGEGGTTKNKTYKTSLRDAVMAKNKAEGWESSEGDDYETFIESLSKGTVSEEITSEHRWYSVQDVVHVVEIEGDTRYFSTFSYYVTGDNHWSDMGLDAPTLDDVFEVYPEEVMTTVYK